jgi:hypothetical protein
VSQQINLFNPIFMKQTKYFSSATMLIGLRIAFLGMGVIYAYAFYQTRSLEVVLIDVDAQLLIRRDQVLKLADSFSTQGRSKLLEEELVRANARLQSGRELLAKVTVGVSANLVGYSSFMTALARQARQGVWLTGFAVSGADEFVIKGRALTADLLPIYLKGLNAETVMRGRSVAELKLTAYEATSSGAAVPAPRNEPQLPTRYVEFSVSLPPRDATGGAAATKERP